MSAPMQAEQPRPDATLPGPEWWERLAEAWRRWRQRHQAGLARWARVRTVALWVGLVALVVAFVAFPQFRTGLRVWLWLYLLLVGWFLVARTKTLSWRLVAGLFAVAVPWSFAISAISAGLSRGVGQVADIGPGTVIAGMTEESLKLLPLAVLALAAPGLVRRFAVTDWLLLGFTCGLAFQAFEELARRTYLEIRQPGVFDLLEETLARIRGENPYGPGSGYAQYGFSLLAGGSSTELAAYAGHHIFTGLVAAGVGLGIAAWRRGRRLATAGGVGAGWWVLALLLPLALWWLVVTDHFGYNATLAVGRTWVETDTPSTPWPIRATWDWFGRGFGRGWLLLALLLLAMLVDARHLRRGEARSGRVLPQPPPDQPVNLAWTPGAVAERWSAGLTGWLPDRRAIWWRWTAGLVAAGCALIAYVARDIMVVVAGHARQPGESRLAAMASGRAAMLALRELRVTAIAAAAPPYGRMGRWPVRIVAAIALAALLVAALRVAPGIAEQIGFSLTDGWLAGLLDRLADWWDGLGLGGQILVGAGIAALVVLSGGSLGLAFGIAGAATFVLDKGHGLADFSRDPARATRSYFATTSPLGMALDLAEFVLTFAPGNFAGGLAGRYARQAGLRTLAPSVNAWRLGAGRSVILVDGTTLRPLSQADAAAVARWGDDIPWQTAPNRTPADVYQRRIYGDQEPVVFGEPYARGSVHGDGLNPGYGSVGDAKYRASASSFHDPNSLPEFLQGRAQDRIRETLLDYRRALNDPSNPLRTLEITTNDPRVARVYAEMMRELDLPGYVVVVP